MPDHIPPNSIIGRLTAEAQAARDAFPYGTVAVTEVGETKVYRMREDWWGVADRAAARFGTVEDKRGKK